MAIPAEALVEYQGVEQRPVHEAPKEYDASISTLNGLPSELAQSELLKQVEIIGIREGGFVECFVPFELVDNEEVPVREEWAADLSRQMGEIAEKQGGTGQHMPVTLGLIPGEPTLKIMDGFHRSAALALRGEERVYATVKLTDWNDLYDFRIFTAKDHAHVRFSRVVQWIREVWNHSGLEDKMTVEQAFLLHAFDSAGKRLKLDHEQAEEAKAWVARKAEGWGVAPLTIHGYLKIAESVDPQLVHSTREKRRSDLLEAPTQDMLKIFSKEIPSRFELQNFVLETAKRVKVPNFKGGQRTLYGPEIRSVCNRIKDCESVEEADRIISAIDWSKFEPEYGETKQRALRRAHDPRHKGATVLSKSVKEIASIRERIKLTHERAEGVDDEQAKLVKEARAMAGHLTRELGSLIVELSELVGEKPPVVSPAKPAPQTAAQLEEAARNRARSLIKDDDEGLSDILDFRYDERMSPEVIHELVDRCLRGGIEVDDIPPPRTPSERRQFRAALSKATEMDPEYRVGNWKERYKDLQILENPALASVLD